MKNKIGRKKTVPKKVKAGCCFGKKIAKRRRNRTTQRFQRVPFNVFSYFNKGSIDCVFEVKNYVK